MSGGGLEEFAGADAIAKAERRAADAERERDNLKLLLKDERATTADLHKALGIVEQIGPAKPPRWARAKKKPPRGHATAFAVFSDQHYGEVVNPAEVRGRNAYDLEIAEKRTRRFGQKAIEMAEQRADIKRWDGLELIMPGDCVAGELRLEDQRTNAGSPQEVIAWTLARLVALVDLLLEFYPAIHVTATVGNHGRGDVKQTAKQLAVRNWDWLVYDLTREHYSSDDRITFDIPLGPDALWSLYGRNYVTTHGNKKRGGSGWGGVASVWLRMMQVIEQDFGSAEGLTLDCAFWGHWHTFADMRQFGFVATSSLKGYDEFAKKNSYRFALPSQTWGAINQEFGIFAADEVFVSDRKAEGW